MRSKERTKCHVNVGPFCTGAYELKDMDELFLNAYKSYMEILNPGILLQPNECVMQAMYGKYEEVAKIIMIKSKDIRQRVFLGATIGIMIVIGVLIPVSYTHLTLPTICSV
eukprot:TRINITY_DN5150_c0_g1_i1.p1 TRINITY_DN5150_c0_g1~~TRINITY_DN5150_c0_g1_i1.p1  ORF type:complete len:111 (-),score=11.84 TRINITY_DN5150_c0_g1_i1:34-366(-)